MPSEDSPPHATGPRPDALSDLEREVLEILWRADAPLAAEAVRELLPRPLQGSTVRTILKRLETKGFTDHRVDGRTYLYRPRVRRRPTAVAAVRHVVDRFLGGSFEELLVGLVDDEVLTRDQLDRLQQRLDEQEKAP